MKRLVIVLLLLAALIFAIQGGEYGTSDLLTLRERRARLVRRIDSLEKAVDSLEKYRRAVATDPRVQERIAREEFGMVRGDKELLYRFAQPRDSTP
jgi:cell division protein FtsB